MQSASPDREQHNPLAEAEHLLQNARTSFSLAGKAKTNADIERYAAMGRYYLGLAHKAARVDEQPMPRICDLP